MNEKTGKRGYTGEGLRPRILEACVSLYPLLNAYPRKRREGMGKGEEEVREVGVERGKKRRGGEEQGEL